MASVKACQEHRVRVGSMQSCKPVYYACRNVNIKILQCSFVEEKMKQLTLSLLC